MKRIFVLISNVLASFFLVWVITLWSDSYVSYFYPNVSVFDSSRATDFQRVSEAMKKLAIETDSLIAIQHQEPGPDGMPIFTYSTFGKGKLPEGLSKKTMVESQNNSVESNYFIFRGDLDGERLIEKLSELGLKNLHLSSPSNVKILASVFGYGFQAIGMLIFFLTFASLSLISQIRMLRSAGIRLISGENRWSIFMSPLKKDVTNSLIGVTVSLVLAVLLKCVIGFPTIGFYTIATGLIVYNLVLLIISLFFASLFSVGIHKVHLMQIIKGQLPVRGIICLILLGQLLAIVIVSIGISRTFIYSQAWQQQAMGHEAWSREKSLVALSVGRSGITPGFGEDSVEKQKTWFKMIDQAISEKRAILSRHYLAEQGLQQGPSASSITPSKFHQNYKPQGNVLMVTPNYFEHQKITLESIVKEKMSHLRTGEFILLLPEHLKSEKRQYKKIFEENITNLMSSQDRHQDMVATVSYLETKHNRFIYNTTPISYQQFLRDPIIIVLTPESTGTQSYSFWEQSLQSYFFFENLSYAQKLVKEHGLEKWVGEFQTGYNNHQALLNKIKREVIAMVVEAILGVLTSLLMFHIMNKLYFEEFRRDIFIKRIGGLRFLEIHRNYLLSQLLVFLLGFFTSVFLATDIIVALLVLFLFISVSVLQLTIQMQKENKISMLILKGA
ncbi:bacteriocin-associated integral membrane family protein [Streptococcus iniae]|uniref:DUF1430 domain-containing protein n=2 Tax=Streptococcus iniae TaxID=1346 RepID=UPI0008DA16D2|nr:DUF1430 domain-containing protein [Streptococcus iniae]OHX26767.1 immunity protein [Streptococcus iniae]RLV27494.1 bacteriocin-associated integral membrane family protein [Streptococcus iniae]